MPPPRTFLGSARNDSTIKVVNGIKSLEALRTDNLNPGNKIKVPTFPECRDWISLNQRVLFRKSEYDSKTVLRQLQRGPEICLSVGWSVLS